MRFNAVHVAGCQGAHRLRVANSTMLPLVVIARSRVRVVPIADSWRVRVRAPVLTGKGKGNAYVRFSAWCTCTDREGERLCTFLSVVRLHQMSAVLGTMHA